ncbi:hypothetical protein [Anaeromicrobium sediminis]|nr:hypothetical protein [Anaeromicrobium sediminis]
MKKIYYEYDKNGNRAEEMNKRDNIRKNILPLIYLSLIKKENDNIK